MPQSRAIALLLLSGASLSLFAQTELKQRPENPPAPPNVIKVDSGTHILLRMLNSVSTKQAQPGDRIYLETAFPVIANNRVVIPPGSWVTGTVTEARRPGRVKGKGELRVRFDSITLPNGITKSFLQANLGAVDGSSKEDFDREHGKVTAENKGGDARTVATTAAAGAGLGATIGAISRTGAAQGGLIGAGAGAAAGMAAVLLTRGPDAVLAKGSNVEMVLDHDLTFDPSELHFGHSAAQTEAVESSQPSQESDPNRPRRFGLPTPF